MQPTALKYQKLREIVPLLVDDEVGIISYVEELPRQFDMPDIIYYKSEIADTGIFGRGTNRPTGGGCSLDRDSAMAKAVGEAVERYSSAIYFPEELVLSSYEDLTQPALHPLRFRTCTKTQTKQKHFALDPFEEQSLVRWVRGVHLSSGDAVLVPAAFVYCPYTADQTTGEANIAEPVSTGLAAHCSFEEAAINGILEVVERDHFMLHWYAMEPCPVIRNETLAPPEMELIRRLDSYGYDVRILLATADTGIPTIIAMMHGRRKGSVPMVIAAASYLDPASAVRKSLEELALMERLSKRVMLTTREWPERDKYMHIRSLADHLKFWLNPEVVPAADFLISKTDNISIQDVPPLATGTPQTDLRLLTGIIEKDGYSVYACDITSQDIRELGMCVVRAVIPEYVPLTISYACRPGGSRRLQKYLDDKHQHSQNGLRRINPLPHPFA